MRRFQITTNDSGEVIAHGVSFSPRGPVSLRLLTPGFRGVMSLPDMAEVQAGYAEQDVTIIYLDPETVAGVPSPDEPPLARRATDPSAGVSDGPEFPPSEGGPDLAQGEASQLAVSRSRSI